MEFHEKDKGCSMIIAFAGHSFVYERNTVKEMVKEQIRKNIADTESVTCYLGGYGDFDELCACASRELKEEYDGIKLVYVTPYLTLPEQERIKEMQIGGLIDTSIYPPIENVPPRFAISKRNEWMMINADLIIAYVNRSCGGAYKSLQLARRKNKKIINVCDLI